MSVFKTNIENKTIENTKYRKVIYTTEQTQLVLMSLLSSEDIPWEKHAHTTQFIRIEKGTCAVYTRDNSNEHLPPKQHRLKDGDIIMIPANTWHYVKATSELKLYTLYSPPEHPPGIIENRQPT